jgi:hypothetical protein
MTWAATLAMVEACAELMTAAGEVSKGSKVTCFATRAPSADALKRGEDAHLGADPGGVSPGPRGTLFGGARAGLRESAESQKNTRTGRKQP